MTSRLRNLRRAKGLTQRELAEQLGIAPSYLGSIERGEQGLSPRMAKRLAVALDSDTSYLLGSGADIPPGPDTTNRAAVRDVVEFFLTAHIDAHGEQLTLDDVPSLAMAMAEYIDHLSRLQNRDALRQVTRSLKRKSEELAKRKAEETAKRKPRSAA